MASENGYITMTLKANYSKAATIADLDEFVELAKAHGLVGYNPKVEKDTTDHIKSISVSGMAKELR
jgi:hypothetical protein